jgi:hypothetical protein
MSVPLIGRVLRVCATEDAASCAAGSVCVGPNSIWPGSLGRQATWERRFESSSASFHSCGGAGDGWGREGGGHEKANGFGPPWLLIVQA